MESLESGSDRYTLLDRIGRGGFGYVYRAKDNLTGDIVAAKLIDLEEAGNEMKMDKKNTKADLLLASFVFAFRIQYWIGTSSLILDASTFIAAKLFFACAHHYYTCYT